MFRSRRWPRRDEHRRQVRSATTRESLQGMQAPSTIRQLSRLAQDRPEGGPAGKYLVDDSGRAVWLVDPGINGVHDVRPDGTEVRKFDAPKATLMSYIIKGILDRELPWELILFGAMIAILMEIAGVPSLAFAVGVYLPISSTAPIFIGGMIRYFIDKRARKAPAAAALSERSSRHNPTAGPVSCSLPATSPAAP